MNHLCLMCSMHENVTIAGRLLKTIRQAKSEWIDYLQRNSAEAYILRPTWHDKFTTEPSKNALQEWTSRKLSFSDRQGVPKVKHVINKHRSSKKHIFRHTGEQITRQICEERESKSAIVPWSRFTKNLRSRSSKIVSLFSSPFFRRLTPRVF